MMPQPPRSRKGVARFIQLVVSKRLLAFPSGGAVDAMASQTTPGTPDKIDVSTFGESLMTAASAAAARAVLGVYDRVVYSNGATVFNAGAGGATQTLYTFAANELAVGDIIDITCEITRSGSSTWTLETLLNSDSSAGVISTTTSSRIYRAIIGITGTSTQTGTASLIAVNGSAVAGAGAENITGAIALKLFAQTDANTIDISRVTVRHIKAKTS